MEEFRKIGEVWGSVKALMVLRDDIRINQRQCCLLLDIFRLAYKTIAEEIKNNLRLEEKNTKWKALEEPLKELHRAFKEGEIYIRSCLDYKDWFGKVIKLHQNKDCVEFHIHNLLSIFPVVIEAIESAEEISGFDQDEMIKRRFMLERKYEKEWIDPRLFQWKLGKQYLVCREICSRLDNAWREDRWLLLEAISEKKQRLGSLTKYEKRLGDLLSKKMSGSEPLKIFPTSVLVGSKDYTVKRRLGTGNEFKEIQWLGENFVLRHIFGEIEPLSAEIFSLLSLSHPNIMQYLCAFCEEEKKECFLVMELMNKDLNTYIKEHSGPKRRIPFTLPVVIDLMLQIARGMEYLHSRKIYHGDLNPSNIFLKARSYSSEGYCHAKITGFGIKKTVETKNESIKKTVETKNESFNNPLIWFAPEVLAEMDQPENADAAKLNEKADVYSFGMLCFQLQTGKVPFEDSHLQGDKMGRNIRAGERPLFPAPAPKYLVNLIRKCWHTDPNQRPSFSSICRILRYIKKFIILNPGLGLLIPPSPSVDYFDIEANYMNRFSVGSLPELYLPQVSQIPFQMFAYRLLEKEKSCLTSELGPICEADFAISASVCGDDNRSVADMPASDIRSVCSSFPERKKLTIKKSIEVKGRINPGTPRGKLTKPPFNPYRSLGLSPRKYIPMVMSPSRHRRFGQISEIS